MQKKSGVKKENRKIVIISGGGIKTKEINLTTIVLITLFLFWVFFTSSLFFWNIKVKSEKIEEILKLNLVNRELSEKIIKLDKTIVSFSEYFRTLSYYDKFSKFSFELDEEGSDSNIISGNKDLLSISEYQKILPVLENIDRNMSFVKIAVNSRINGLKNILESISLSRKANNLYSKKYKDLNSKDDVETAETVRYLSFLEFFLNSIPISKPMKNYYISSKYGIRIDPFLRAQKSHKGLDFAGPRNSNVLASADGKVKLVDFKKGFGNLIVIDHGNDIETVYAHLKKTNVKSGDIVKRGDVIAVQGNSGRTTGDHLHYEVKINGINQDPNKFVNVGGKMEY